MQAHQRQCNQGPVSRLQHGHGCEQHQALLPQARQAAVSPAPWFAQEQFDSGSALSQHAAPCHACMSGVLALPSLVLTGWQPVAVPLRADLEACLDAAQSQTKQVNGSGALLQVPAYVHAGARQFCFMLRALEKVEPKLKALNIPFYMLQGDPTETLPKLVADSKASLLVTDFAPLRLGREWRDKVRFV